MRSGDRVPEVVIKVISGGSNALEAIQAYFEDLQNGKNRALEMDFFSTPVVGKKAARALIDDWILIWMSFTGVSPIWYRDDARYRSSCTRFSSRCPQGHKPTNS